MNRVAVGGEIYHVINRANNRATIFKSEKDYQHFEGLLEEGVELIGMRILSYCVMPNHWHLVLYPKKDTDMGEFMRWVTTTHVRQKRSQTETIGHGHLYQGTYKSFPVESDKHLIDLIRYVEQNPLRAKLTARAQDWKWSSLWRREQGTVKQQRLLTKLPTLLPSNYLESVNQILDKEKLGVIRNSVNKGAPFGSSKWTDYMVDTYNMGSTLRGSGRPKKA